MTRIVRVGEPEKDGELLVPMARVLYTTRPGTTLKDIADLPYQLGGQAAKPVRPLGFMGADGSATLIAGLGVTEAAELQDQAYALLERQEQRARDGEGWRERLGFAPRASFDARVREHMAEKVNHLRRNGGRND